MTLHQFMKANGLTVEQMASKIGGVSPSGVRKWLYRERTPRPDQMRRIIAATNGDVTANDFVDQSGEAA